jgi:hypothetical protein
MPLLLLIETNLVANKATPGSKKPPCQRLNNSVSLAFRFCIATVDVDVLSKLLSM